MAGRIPPPPGYEPPRVEPDDWTVTTTGGGSEKHMRRYDTPDEAMGGQIRGRALLKGGRWHWRLLWRRPRDERDPTVMIRYGIAATSDEARAELDGAYSRWANAVRGGRWQWDRDQRAEAN